MNSLLTSGNAPTIYVRTTLPATAWTKNVTRSVFCREAVHRFELDTSELFKRHSALCSVSLFRCWCKHGTYGDFCDYTEEMRICSEDVCNHHGIINVRTFNETTKCECKCEEYYSGSNVGYLDRLSQVISI